VLLDKHFNELGHVVVVFEHVHGSRHVCVFGTRIISSHTFSSIFIFVVVTKVKRCQS
jgi:hypothetical protein